MFKAEYIVCLWVYRNISCIFRTTQWLIQNFGQQLLGLTLRVNPWLWNWAQVFTTH